MSGRTVPDYRLYGEKIGSDAPLAIHIEEIVDRSRGQDWLIKPHRHGRLFQMLCIFNGELNVQLDGEDHHLQGNWLVAIPMGTVHGFRFAPDSDGVVISLASEMIANAAYLEDPEYLRPLVENPHCIQFGEGDEQFRQLRACIDLLRYEFAAANSARPAALALQVSLLLITVKRQWEHNTLRVSGEQSSGRILDRFRRLVESHYREQWRVADYAENLHISTSTLNRLCREGYGKSAKALILARVMAEAKRRLMFTRQNLDQIALHLGFKDPAYFSRLFKRLEKVSPRQYREALRGL